MATNATIDEIKAAEQTFGVWKLNQNTLIVSYLDGQNVRMSNSKGEIFSIPTREWLDRWDFIRDVGWVHYSLTLSQTFQKGAETRTVYFDNDGKITLVLADKLIRTTYGEWQKIKDGWRANGWRRV